MLPTKLTLFLKKVNPKIIVAILLLYPLLFIWQGGDLTDTGLHCTRYQNFFTWLSTGKLNSLTMLTDFIGALFYNTFPNLGVIGFKFLGVCCYYIILFFSYQILKNIIHNKLILYVGILMGFMLSTRISTFVFTYDSLSFLSLSITAFLVTSYYSLNTKGYMFVAGMVFFLAFLAKFPTIVFLGLLPLIIIYIHFYKSKNGWLQPSVSALTDIILFYLGFLVMLVILYGTLKHYNLWELYSDNLKQAFSKDKSSSYSLTSLIIIYLKDLLKYVPYAVTVAFTAVTLAVTYNYTKYKQHKIYFFCAVFLLFVVSFLLFRGFVYNNPIKYFVAAVVTVPLLMVLIVKHKASTILAIILGVVLAQIAGTNTGLFSKLSSGMIILIPLCLHVLWTQNHITVLNIKIHLKPLTYVAVFFIVFFTLWLRLGVVNPIAFGVTARLQCTTPVTVPKMRGVYTTKANATHIVAVTTAIEKHLTPNNSLFVYGHQPMLYFLSEQTPATKPFWLINGVISPNVLFENLNTSIATQGKYPLIVDTKQNIMGDTGQHNLEQFLKQHEYYIAEENDTYFIWQTKL